MKTTVRMQSAFTCGGAALEYLEQVACEKIVMIMDKTSTRDEEISQKVARILENKAVTTEKLIFSGKEGYEEKITTGVSFLKEKRPDTVIAVGEVETIDAAKNIVYLYEAPKEQEEDAKLHTKFIVVPSNSMNATAISQINTILVDDSFMQTSYAMLR